MDRLDPDKIDDIFRESAENSEFAFNEAAWEDLEGRLDDRDRKRRILGILLVMLLVGLIAGIGYFSMTNVYSAPEISKSEKTTHNVEKSLAVENNDTNDSDSFNNEASSEKDQLTAVDAQLNKAIISNRRNRNIKENKATASTRVIVVETGHQGDEIINRATQKDKPKVDDVSVNSLKSKDRTPILIAKIDRLESHTLVAESSREMPMVGLSAMDMSPVSKQAFLGYIGMSKVGTKLSSLTKTGYNVGLAYHLGLGDHIEVSAGLGLTKQQYSCPGSVYHKDDDWDGGVVPETMDGEYIMTEIPIAINYHLRNRSKSGFVLSGQLSTYFINKEWYGFHYSDLGMQTLIAKNITPLMEVTEYNTNSIELVGRVGIGYQSNLNHKVSLQIMPYVQIPITDVGIGKIQLYSGGVNLAIKYRK